MREPIYVSQAEIEKVRGLSLEPEAIRARARGVNEIREDLPVLSRIEVHYDLRIPTGSRALVDRALERHAAKCPTAASLEGAVEVTWSAEIQEE